MRIVSWCCIKATTNNKSRQYATTTNNSPTTTMNNYQQSTNTSNNFDSNLLTNKQKHVKHGHLTNAQRLWTSNNEISKTNETKKGLTSQSVRVPALGQFVGCEAQSDLSWKELRLGSKHETPSFPEGSLLCLKAWNVPKTSFKSFKHSENCSQKRRSNGISRLQGSNKFHTFFDFSVFKFLK